MRTHGGLFKLNGQGVGLHTCGGIAYELEPFNFYGVVAEKWKWTLLCWKDSMSGIELVLVLMLQRTGTDPDQAFAERDVRSARSTTGVLSMSEPRGHMDLEVPLFSGQWGPTLHFDQNTEGED